MSNAIFQQSQIRIIQAGKDLFGFTSIRWPDETFEHPIVYMAEAMDYGSADANKIGWTWMSRTQYEWILRHFECIVEYVGMEKIPGGRMFYCHNHMCWEEDGVDQIDAAAHYKQDPEVYEEREI